MFRRLKVRSLSQRTKRRSVGPGLIKSPGVPLESIHKLFQGNIVAGATRDVIPRYSRAKHLSQGGNGESDEHYDDEEGSIGKKHSVSSHVERVDNRAKDAAYGANNAGAS